MLPWVTPHLAAGWNEEDETTFDYDRLAGAVRVVDTAPRRVAAIFRLERRPGPASEVAPLAEVEALRTLAEDNVMVGGPEAAASQSRQLAELATLVRRVPVYRLIAGSDLGGLAPAAARALAGQA